MLNTLTWGFWVIWYLIFGIAAGKYDVRYRWLYTSDCKRIIDASLRFLSRQEAFMENYFTSQRDNIFRNVEVLIYVFDVESRELDKDMHYYQSCLEAILNNSPEAKVFCLIHKMDLIQDDQRDTVGVAVYYKTVTYSTNYSYFVEPILVDFLSTRSRLEEVIETDRMYLFSYFDLGRNFIQSTYLPFYSYFLESRL